MILLNKKLSTLIGGLLLVFNASAQIPSIQLSGSIESDRFLSSDTNYILNGNVFVKNGATLTIEAGTVIKGFIDTTGNTAPGSLIITRNGRIEARGTSCSPIVFTSSNPSGQRNPGDWGGLFLLGEGQVNSGVNMGTFFLDVIDELVSIDVNDRIYGGQNDAHDAGSLQYVRLEYGGANISANENLDALTLAGVGSNTIIDHIMVSYSGNDAISVKGGGAIINHLVTLGTGGDDVSADQGFRGKFQFGLVYKEASIANASGSESFWFSNDEQSPNVEPRTEFMLSNFTVIGPGATGTPDTNHDAAIRIRRGAWTSIHNSVFTDAPTGLYMQSPESFGGWSSNDMQMKGNVLAGMTQNYKIDSLVTTGGIDTLWTMFNENVSSSGALGLSSAYNQISNPDLLLVGSSMLLAGSDWNFTGNEEFAHTSYRGAFNSSNDWTNKWTDFDPQNINYDIQNAPVVDSVTFIDQRQGVALAHYSNLPFGSSYRLVFGSTDDTIVRTKTFEPNGTGTQKFNITPWYNTNIYVDLGVLSNDGWVYSCKADTFYNECKPMTVQAFEQEEAFCEGDSALLRVGFAGGMGNKSILWSNGATAKRIFADQGDTMWVTVSDTRGCSVSDTIVATAKNLTAAPTNFSISKIDPARFLGVWTAPVVDSNVTIIGYRMAYRLRGTTSWTVSALTTSTFQVLNFNGSGNPAGNYDFVAFARYNDGASSTSSNFTCIEAKGYNGSGNKREADDLGSTSSIEFNVYPNPVNDYLKIDAPAGTSIELVNVQGQSLIKFKASSFSETIDMSSYPSALYLLRFEKDGFTQIERVTRQ